MKPLQQIAGAPTKFGHQRNQAGGYIVGGPYEGKKMVAVLGGGRKTGIMAQGEFNEFAGDLKTVELTLKPVTRKGVQFKH